MGQYKIVKGDCLEALSENWILVRRPLGLDTVAENVSVWGTGGLNIDASRIGTDEIKNNSSEFKAGFFKEDGGNGKRWSGDGTNNPQGRYPSNVVFSHHPECELVGEKEVRPSNGSGKTSSKAHGFHDKFVGGAKKAEGFESDYSKETVPDWNCHAECAVKELDKQSGPCKTGDIKSGTLQGFGGGANTFGEGVVPREYKSDAPTGASRFFYCAKASKADRNAGLDDKQNVHPTVKNTELMKYLIRLVTPPKGVVLDPFMGSGSTGVAAMKAGFNFYGVELEPEYFEIAKARLKGLAK